MAFAVIGPARRLAASKPRIFDFMSLPFIVRSSAHDATVELRWNLPPFSERCS
jgi:hypothetical protein